MKSLVLSLALVAAARCASGQVIQNATSAEFVEKFVGGESATRSLRNIGARPASVDLSIHFGFNSAQPQSASKPLLDNLAMAMNSERLASVRFLVQGHTDAKGKAPVNQQLSELRAQAVQKYLIAQGVQGDRLRAEGKGASDLLLPDKPFAPENRRVRVTMIQP